MKILEKQIRFPLDIFFCEDCFHMQLLDIVDPNILFENYVYVSGTSPIFVKHFEEYTDYILEKLKSLQIKEKKTFIIISHKIKPLKICNEIIVIDRGKISEILKELPTTYQTPTMAPFCKDEEKYKVVESIVEKIKNLKTNNTKIDGQNIINILTVNGVRFSLEDGSWGLIRASSNKPSLVVVTESPTSDKRKKKIFEFIDRMLQKTGKVGDYDQKI